MVAACVIGGIVLLSEICITHNPYFVSQAFYTIPILCIHELRVFVVVYNM